MHQDCGAGGALQTLDSPHMVNVRVRGNNVLRLQVVLFQYLLHLIDVVARIDHDRFAG